jgi:hypothetical protein
MKDRQSLLAQLETLLPLAVEWAAAEEQPVLREGVPLSEQEMADAKSAGVRDSSKLEFWQLYHELPYYFWKEIRERRRSVSRECATLILCE